MKKKSDKINFIFTILIQIVTATLCSTHLEQLEGQSETLESIGKEKNSICANDSSTSDICYLTSTDLTSDFSFNFKGKNSPFTITGDSITIRSNHTLTIKPPNDKEFVILFELKNSYINANDLSIDVGMASKSRIKLAKSVLCSDTQSGRSSIPNDDQTFFASCDRKGE